MGVERSPLGIMPHYIWVEMRLQALAEAIQRYVDAGQPVPVKWIEEYNEHLSKMR